MSGCAAGHDGGLRIFTLTPTLSYRGRGGLPFYIDGQDEQDWGGDGIATWFDRLTMSGCAAGNDGGLRISPSPQLSPIKGEGARLPTPHRVRGRDGKVGAREEAKAHIAYEITATSLRLSPESRVFNLLDFRREATGIGHWIPAFAGMTVVKPSICDCPGEEARVIRLSLRGAQRRGNLVEVEHVPGNHHCYGDEIATLRSQ